MAETLAQYFVDFLQNKIPNELIVFIVSLFPILELRGGMIVAKLLDVPFITAFLIFVYRQYGADFLSILLIYTKRLFRLAAPSFPRVGKNLLNKLERPLYEVKAIRSKK